MINFLELHFLHKCAIPKREKKASSEIGKTLIPSMYALTLRPPSFSSAHFDHSKYNSTGIWPGWDYAPEMPGSHIPPVLVLLYFEPLVRANMLQRQYDKRLFSSKTVDQVPTLSTELGFLFHHIQSLSQYAMCYSGNGVLPHVDVFRPINFLNSFMAMPEAKNLALLDDHPIAPVRARRPEAFYRFLLHHLDREAGSKKSKAKPLDSTHGADFESTNTFISGKGKTYISSTRSMTLDLCYDNFVSMKDASEIRFGDILYHSLRRETRLRAWNSETKAYETVLQRKMVSTFPKVLSITCGCSGGSSEHGLSLWQKTKLYWLPEVIEIEMNEESNLVVREQIGTEFDQIEWHVVGADSSIQARNLDDAANPPTKSKVLYRLDAVLSFIPDGSNLGHHVVHVRVPTTLKERALEKQVKNAEQLLKHLQANASKSDQHLTLTAKVPIPIVSNRIQRVKESMLSKQPQLSEWILFNGYVVTQASAEDVRSFNMGYKEPCLVIYRDIQENIDLNPEAMNVEKRIKDLGNVMQSKSISTGKPSIYAVKDLNGKCTL
jgi:Ubiquitin carboxyl-terminal hydrolase